VFLPDMLGWNVLSQLKQNPLTRHYPGADQSPSTRTVSTGWRAAPSPSSPSRRRARAFPSAGQDQGLFAAAAARLLVVEDNKAEQMSIRELLGHDDIEIVNAETAGGARHPAPGHLRLRGARSAPARHVGLRGARKHAQ